MSSAATVPQSVHPCDSLSVDEECLFAEVVNECEVVVSARVLGVGPEPSLARTVGDRAFVVTGRRFGLPGPYDGTQFRLQRLASIKGSVESEFSVFLPEDDLRIISDGFSRISKARPVEGHDYLICVHRAHGKLQLDYASDVAQWPALAEETARFVRKNPLAQPRRRTTRQAVAPSRHAACGASRAPLGPRVIASVGRWTDRETEGKFFSNPEETMPVRTFKFVVERDPDTGHLVGYVPGWPGAHTQGADIDELQRNLAEVIEMLLEDGEPVLESEFVDVRTIQVA